MEDFMHMEAVVWKEYTNKKGTLLPQCYPPDEEVQELEATISKNKRLRAFVNGLVEDLPRATTNGGTVATTKLRLSERP